MAAGDGRRRALRVAVRDVAETQPRHYGGPGRKGVGGAYDRCARLLSGSSRGDVPGGPATHSNWPLCVPTAPCSRVCTTRVLMRSQPSATIAAPFSAACESGTHPCLACQAAARTAVVSFRPVLHRRQWGQRLRHFLPVTGDREGIEREAPRTEPSPVIARAWGGLASGVEVSGPLRRNILEKVPRPWPQPTLQGVPAESVLP